MPHTNSAFEEKDQFPNVQGMTKIGSSFEGKTMEKDAPSHLNLECLGFSTLKINLGEYPNNVLKMSWPCGKRGPL